MRGVETTIGIRDPGSGMRGDDALAPAASRRVSNDWRAALRNRILASGFRIPFFAALFLLLAACSPQGTPEDIEMIGEPGRQPGQFSKPRAVAVTGEHDLIIIDRTGRVQVFDLRSNAFLHQWRLPAWENGTPTGISADPQDGALWVADTHYSRILVYNREGNLLRQWGEYGEEPGKLFFATDVCPDPDGETVWITDFGRRNRVMQFTREGEFLQEWGAEVHTSDELNRPMAIAVAPDGERLYVVDAGNHRLNVYDREGKLLEYIGSVGDGPGQLRYPYDLAVAEDGSLFVLEYGNHRVSWLSEDGAFLGAWAGPGSDPGELASPWGCALAPDGTLIIADTMNQRLQILRNPARFFLDEDLRMAAGKNGSEIAR